MKFLLRYAEVYTELDAAKIHQTGFRLKLDARTFSIKVFKIPECIPEKF